MYSDINGLNLNSMEMLEYIELDDGDINSQRTNRQRAINLYMTNKINMKAGLAIIRVIMLYFFYYLDNSQMTFFLKNLIGFLLIHEALVFTNSFLVITYQSGNQFLGRDETSFPTFCAYFDIFNNFIFFTWFAYGNLCILTDREGIETSLIHNKMLTYYVTVMILLGFFIYSKLIFYIIFFVSFCPCITYVLCVDIHQEYHNSRRAHRINQRLKEEVYENFVTRVGFELEGCIICAGEFNNKDVIINLPCNQKHTFHAECIRQWVDKKAICPLCRVELRSTDEEDRGISIRAPSNMPLNRNGQN